MHKKPATKDIRDRGELAVPKSPMWPPNSTAAKFISEIKDARSIEKLQEV